MILTILALVIAIPLAMIFVGIIISAPKYKGPASDHFDGRRFVNPGGVRARGGWDLVKWMVRRKKGPWTEDLSERYGKHPLGHFKDGIRITFVNHSTFLVQVEGVNILTDPVWSRRVSPFSWAGPRRMRLPGIRFEDLPPIHLVLVSHNHYDHLDVETMRMVMGAHHPKVIVPLGVKKLLDQEYISGAEEGDWWEEFAVADQLKVQLVPALHFSGRGFLDRDASLWCGYVIKTPSGNIYFAGDTGYDAGVFKHIGERSGPIRVSMLPIGAYKPSWFMSPIHVSPEEAVRIHKDIGSENSIAMHYGTFPLADDGMEDPIHDLAAALATHRLPAEVFTLLREGDFVVFE